MGWLKESLSDGELDALSQAARLAWADDTRLPRYATRRPHDGQCYVSSMWLVRRLGGHVGIREGHFAWLSADKHFYIDLTGAHSGRAVYERNSDFSYQPYLHTPSASVTRRSARFAKRADQIFASLDVLLKCGTDLGAGDAYPAEEPQAQSDRDQADSYWHDEPEYDPGSADYQFVYANQQLEVSPNHSHGDLASHIGIDPAQHTGPIAAGHISVRNGRATYEVDTNVNIKALERIFKEHAKQVGWQWGGITNGEGEPISDEFAPKTTKTLNWTYDPKADHLRLGRVSHAELLLLSATEGQDEGHVPSYTGRLTVCDKRAEVLPVVAAALPSLLEWAEDSGLTLYAGNDNVYKTQPDLEMFDFGDDGDDSTFHPQVDERDPVGLFRCPSCDQLFGSWDDYNKHRREQESNGDAVEDGKFPDLDMDQVSPFEPHYTPQQPDGITTGAVIIPAGLREARRVYGFARYAEAFGYDTEEGYTHYVAYANGSPVGYASVSDENHVQMVHTAVQHKGYAHALLYKLMLHRPLLTTSTVHDWEAEPLRKAGWVNTKGQMWKWSLDSPSQTLEAAVPFIYDVQEDKVFVGHAGSRTSDIPGRFTPGGIVEGTYEPGGKVFIRSMTTIPYTVHHLIQLWYYTHPELEVKSVHLRDDEGKDTRLAHSEIGPMVAALARTSDAVRSVTAYLEAWGGEVYVVGGAVRDVIANKRPNDFDLMVTKLSADDVAGQLKKIPGRVDYTGKDFGVFRLKMAGDEIEVALPRRDRSTGDGHRDFDVEADHTMAPEEDLYRRDFTANSMAVRLRTDPRSGSDGALLDPFGGAADIASGVLRVLNENSFVDDPLRVVRALVVRARHGLEPEAVTRMQMRDAAHRLAYLPAERIQAELDKLIESKDPVAGIKLAHATEVLKHIFPEVDATFGYDQKNPHHAHDLGTHLMEVLDRMAAMTEDRDLRYAALLHDIGKPASAWWHPEQERRKYYQHRPERDLRGEPHDHYPVDEPLVIKAGTIVGKDHHTVGGQMARERLRALKFPNDRIERIGALIDLHMWHAFESKRGARKFLASAGIHADDLLLFRVADQGGKGDAVKVGEGRTPEGIKKQANLVERVRNEGEPHSYDQLAVDGHDLIEAGVPEGPEIGRIKRLLLSKVIDQPEYNTREHLLSIAQRAAAYPEYR